MKRNMRYYRDGDICPVEEEYSEKKLVDRMLLLGKEIGADEADFWLFEDSPGIASVWVSLRNHDRTQTECRTILLHEIDLEEEEVSRYLKEFQKMKRYAAGHLPGWKVSSSFRW